MEYKVWINYILVRLKIRKILPSKIISRVKIKECNEPLVRIDKDSNFVFDKRMKPPIFLRKTVYEKLKVLSKQLEKEGIKIKLYDAYRSLEEQINSWEKRLEETRKEFPNLSEEEVKAKTNFKVANPIDKNNVGGHQTGGAIDITLISDNGVEFDMGTKYEEYNEKTKTDSKLITKEQIKNRKKLLNALKRIRLCKLSRRMVAFLLWR